MSARRHAAVAVVAAVLAVVLWWVSRDVVVVEPPVLDPPVEGMIEVVLARPWPLLAATVLAAVAMVSATLAVLRGAARSTD